MVTSVLHKWLNETGPQNERRIVYSNIASDEEEGILCSLESTESIEQSGIVLDCDAFMAALLDRQLKNVDEKSIVYKLGREYVGAHELEKLKQYSVKINSTFVSVVRKGLRRFQERHPADLASPIEDEVDEL
jgi:hypothetical protein